MIIIIIIIIIVYALHIGEDSRNNNDNRLGNSKKNSLVSCYSSNVELGRISWAYQVS